MQCPCHSGAVSSAARAAAARLPAGPGVYRFRDAAGRVLYIGRAGHLRRRVASYWGDLGDRRHLRHMVGQIGRLEAIACASEHEAAWLERNLLERSSPRWNVTPGGQETEVRIRLDTSPRAPGLAVVHATDQAPRPDQVRHFGPYLGGARVRLAVAGLHRIFPLGYAGDAATGSVRAFGRERGVTPADRAALAQRIAAVLDRDPAAVAVAAALLTERRDAASSAQAYELAGRVQAELAALDWVTGPQRAASPDRADADVAGWTDGVLVRFEIRAGRLNGWRQYTRSRAQAERWLARTPPAWREFAARNAALAADLAAGHQRPGPARSAG
jgi:excinuclease ABC subunit C